MRRFFSELFSMKILIFMKIFRAEKLLNEVSKLAFSVNKSSLF